MNGAGQSIFFHEIFHRSFHEVFINFPLLKLFFLKPEVVGRFQVYKFMLQHGKYCTLIRVDNKIFGFKNCHKCRDFLMKKDKRTTFVVNKS